MQFEIIRSLDALSALSDEWNNLLTCCSASHVPFLRHEYLSTWWQTLGGGEWEAGELFTVIARSEDGTLCGIAPLFFTNNPEGEPALMLLGSIEISDYLDFIIRDTDVDIFTNALFELLQTDAAPPWQVLDFYNLLEDSATIPALNAAAEAHNWTFNLERLQPCPYITFPDDWESYLAGLKKKHRHEIRRKLRRAANYHQPVSWYIVKDEATLDTEIDAFMHLMAQDEEKEHFLTEVMRTQMRSSIHTTFRAGWLQLAFLMVGDQKAAGYLNFDFANHIWVYNSGIDFNYRELSPGWVLLSYLLQWAIDNNRTCFDFMRGNEAYKYRFGGIERFVKRVTIRR